MVCSDYFVFDHMVYMVQSTIAACACVVYGSNKYVYMSRTGVDRGNSRVGGGGGGGTDVNLGRFTLVFSVL